VNAVTNLGYYTRASITAPGFQLRSTVLLMTVCGKGYVVLRGSVHTTLYWSPHADHVLSLTPACLVNKGRYPVHIRYLASGGHPIGIPASRHPTKGYSPCLPKIPRPNSIFPTRPLPRFTIKSTTYFMRRSTHDGCQAFRVKT